MLLSVTMVEAALNFQTQTRDIDPNIDLSSLEDSSKDAAKVQKGTLDSQAIQADTDVDPSTKDDECLSAFFSRKLVKKEQRKKNLRTKGTSSKSIFTTEESKSVHDQDVRSKRVTREIEVRLNLIYNDSLKNLQETIQGRSQALFSGSESKYEKFFKKLDQSAQQKNFQESTIRNALKDFTDVAEQHNALQIIRDVWERKLSALKYFSHELKSSSKKGEKKESEEQQVHQQIQSLEAQLNELEKIQTELMTKHKNRIEDSYQLAPLLREVTAFFTHDITLPPKDFNALILDKLLPLKGNPLQTFQLLTQTLIESFPNTKSACAHFHENIDLVTTCLTSELKSCPNPSIASAIVNACRTTEKLSTIQTLHVQLLQKTFQTFPHLA